MSVRSVYGTGWSAFLSSTRNRVAMVDPRSPLGVPATMIPRAADSARFFMMDSPGLSRWDANANRMGRAPTPWQSKVRAAVLNPSTFHEVIPPGEAITVEIEFVTPRDSDWMEDEGGIIRSLRERYRLLGVTPVSDGSVHGSASWFTEARVTQVYGNWQRMARFIDILREKGCYVTSRCGLHVHIDCRDVDEYSARARFLRLRAAEPWLFLITRADRFTNMFCVPHISGRRPSNPRYRAVSWAAYQRHETIEVRLRHGTLDPREIVGWCQLLWHVAHSKRANSEEDAVAMLPQLPPEAALLLRNGRFMADTSFREQLRQFYGERIMPRVTVEEILAAD